MIGLKKIRFNNYFILNFFIVRGLFFIFATVLLNTHFLYAQTTISIADADFSGGNDSPFQKNGDATLDNNDLRLTRSVNDLYGTVFSKQLINLADDRSFSAHFSFSMPNPACFVGNGADGLAFVLQTEGDSSGGVGEGSGYGGISPAVAVEFDTFQNPEVNDPVQNHIGININGDTESIATSVPGYTFNDGATYYVWIDYNGSTTTLDVRMSATNVRPNSPTLSQTLDVSSILDQNVYVGFTAATGGCREEHRIKSFYFNNSLISGGITPNTVTYVPSTAVLEVSGPSSIVASGSDSGTYTFTAKNPRGTPVADRAIALSTTLGSLSSTSGTTNSSGIVTTNLTSTNSGVARVWGIVAGGIIGSKNVSISAPTPTPTVTPTPTRTVTPTRTSIPAVTPPASTTPIEFSTTNATPVISGSAPVNANVEVYVDAVYVGTTTSDSTGAWRYVVASALAVGTHEITIVTVDSAGNRSASVLAAVIEVRREAFLDFDGDGITDITASRIQGNKLKFFSHMSSAGKNGTHLVDGTIAVPGDYDGDKKWDYAGLKAVRNKLKWTISQSLTHTTKVMFFGNIGDTVLSGCRLSPGIYTPVVVKGKRIGFRTIDGTVKGNYLMPTALQGSVLGCGDVNGDGQDEIIFLGKLSGNAYRIYAFDALGKTVLRNQVQRFSKGFLLRSGDTGLPLIGGLNGLSGDRHSLEIRTLRGIIEFPLFYLPGRLDIASGSFVNRQGTGIVTGVTWQAGRTSQIYSLLAGDKASRKIIKVPTGYTIARPQEKIVINK